MAKPQKFVAFAVILSYELKFFLAIVIKTYDILDFSRDIFYNCS